MIVETARPEDAPRIAQILGDWVYEIPDMPRIHTREDDLAHANHLIEKFIVTIGRDNGQVQGFLARDGAKVQALYLAPEARGQGLGHRLITRAKAEAGRLELWCFVFNTGAQRFYLREGFREVKRTDGADNDEKLPDIYYVWDSTEQGS